jgi:hypothetical protein
MKQLKIKYFDFHNLAGLPGAHIWTTAGTAVRPMPTANLASALQAAGQHVQRLTPATPVAVLLEVLQKEINETLRAIERVTPATGP